jgi:two-component system sensor histidine kinase/response regulator
MVDDELRQRLHRLERLALGSRDGYWERDLKRGTSWYSPSFREMFGFAADALPDDRDAVNARIHPDDIAPFLARYDEALARGGHFSYELRYRDAAEQWRWIRGRGRVWPDADGTPEFITGAISDVHAEKCAQESLRALGQRFARAIDASAEGLFERVIGEPGMHMSDRYLELTGDSRDTAPTEPEQLAKRLHPDDVARYRTIVGGAMRSGQRWELDYRFRHANGEYRWYRQRGRAERGPDGRTIVTGMLADVHEQTLQRQEVERTRAQLEALVAERTERLQTALALARHRQREAERADAAKSRFVAHMSHEIRTPLNGVLGMLELAERGTLAPEQQRYLETARRAGDMLLQTINGVLDFSRIEAGRIELRPAPFDLACAIVETMRSVMPTARDRPVVQRFDWIGPEPQLVGDEGAIRQILMNLIGNAAKFTREGHVSVTVETVEAGAGMLDVSIAVEDSGPGIPLPRRARIFDAFEQGDDSLAREHGGTGLGLAIARALARAMNGDIALDAPTGGGSRFTLRLRLRTRPGSDSAPPQPPQPPGEAWLVGFSPLGGPWLARRLQRQAWHVRLLDGAADVMAAARTSLTWPAQVLVSEQGLTPQLDLAALRRALPGVAIDLIIRPDWHDPGRETLARAQRIGTLLTPLTPTSLAGLGRTPAPPAGTARGLPPACAWPPGAEVLLVEDNPVNQLIGQEFLQALGLPVRTVDDGEQALLACLEKPPAVVLMDLQMPGMDGLEAARRLRQLQAEKRWPGAPIIALTAHAADSDRHACLAAGMNEMLTKPLGLETLRKMLLKFLK